jgi:hypothetical protein
MNGYQQALERGCATVGLDADGARLLRLGSNAVYRLKAPVVVRISRPGAELEHASRTVAVARWLESVSYPAVRVVHVDQPVDVGGYVVTFWQAISDDGDQYASTPEIAEVLARLHQLATPEELSLPPLAPFANAARRVADNTWLSPGDHPSWSACSPSCKTLTLALNSSCRRESSTATPASGTCSATATGTPC